MRRITPLVRTLFAGVLVAAAITGIAAPAQAAIDPPTGGWAELFNPQRPLINGTYQVCLDVPSGTTSTGVTLQMYHCHGYASNGAPQRWVFTHLSDGSYWVYNQSNLLCLTEDPSAGQSSGVVKQYECGTQDAQTWRIVPDPTAPDTRFLLYNTSSSPRYANTCLNASNGLFTWDLFFGLCSFDLQGNPTNYLQVWALG